MFPKLFTELMRVPKSILRDGIEVKSLRGLSNLKALNADREAPPLFKSNNVMTS